MWNLLRGSTDPISVLDKGKRTHMQQDLKDWLERPAVRNGIIAAIVFNAIILGLETTPGLTASQFTILRVLDLICLGFFVAELLLKLVAYRGGFFRNGWNLFDSAIIAISLVPGVQTLTVLRALRVLRVLRVISVMPRMRRVVEGFVTALPGMASVFLLMALVFYIGSVMATKLFGEAFPEWFGNLGYSAYSLFQIMTLESWSMGIVRPVMEVYPYAWMFFVPFILLTTFAVVNLLVGLIVNSMQDAHHAEDNERTDAYRDEVLARLEAIEARLSKSDT